jgi:hypothetical protein
VCMFLVFGFFLDIMEDQADVSYYVLLGFGIIAATYVLRKLQLGVQIKNFKSMKTYVKNTNHQ